MPNYPNPTGVRMAIDRDGTTVVLINNDSGSVVTATLTTGQIQTINDDSTSNWLTSPASQNGALCALFPEGRTLQGIFWAAVHNSGSITNTAAYSLNTTNGIDGTWTTISNPASSSSVNPQYRTPTMLGVPVDNVKGVRVTWVPSGGNQENVYAFHIYGKKTAASDRLEMWHPTLNQPLTDFPAWWDFEDKPRNATYTKSFRVKNLSATLTANTITASSDELNTESPTLISQTRFRYNAGAYGATASLSALAPGSISQVFDVELALTSTAFLGLSTERYIVSAASWS